MVECKVYGEELNNIPWEDRKENDLRVMWRYSENPIVGRNPAKGISRIFNSAVVPYKGAFIGVFRAESATTRPFLHLGRSKNAIDWDIEESAINFVNENGEEFNPKYAYDPRLIEIDETYYIIWCTDFYGASLGLAKTDDFKTFVRLDNPFLPYNRNGVFFPRKINGNFVLLSRPSDSSHTPFGDIFISESPDLVYWGKHKHVMSRGGESWWQSVKIGGGPAPIETTEGWLLIYHGVTGTCNGLVYSIGAAILDIDDLSKVKYRCKDFILTPEEWYEERGFVPNVVFPCATLHDSSTGRIAVYYGAADTYVGLAFCQLNELIKYIKDNNEVIDGDSDIGIM